MPKDQQRIWQCLKEHKPQGSSRPSPWPQILTVNSRGNSRRAPEPLAGQPQLPQPGAECMAARGCLQSPHFSAAWTNRSVFMGTRFGQPRGAAGHWHHSHTLPWPSLQGRAGDRPTAANPPHPHHCKPVPPRAEPHGALRNTGTAPAPGPPRRVTSTDTQSEQNQVRCFISH